MNSQMKTLLRVRRNTEDEAKRLLAVTIQEEAEARLRTRAAEAQVGREGEIAADLTVGDGGVEAFAAWLPTGRAQVDRARSAQERASANVALARAALTLAHAAAEATESFLQRQAEAANAAMAKRSQAALDEVAAGLKNRNPAANED